MIGKVLLNTYCHCRQRSVRFRPTIIADSKYTFDTEITVPKTREKTHTLEFHIVDYCYQCFDENKEKVRRRKTNIGTSVAECVLNKNLNQSEMKVRWER